MITVLHGLEGQSLLEVIRASDYQLRAPCAGRGTCRKCRVQLHDAGEDGLLSVPTTKELEQLSAEELASGIRFACLTRFQRAGELSIELQDDRIVSPSEQLVVSIDPSVKQLAVDSGLRLRIAVDIGTTTIAACLVDVQAGAVLSVLTETNAQKSWGSDVVARIQSVCDHPAALSAMQKSIVRQLDHLIHKLLAGQGHQASELGLVAVAGNTTMLHLLAGETPAGMARFPFHPVFLESCCVSISDYGFKLPSTCQLLLLPGISAFVGADITAGVLATGIYQAEGMELLLDIGTNGEMVLGNRQGLLATATAAGPAFEGAQITHGCPGIAGALDHAGEGAEGFWYTTVNEAPLCGICGSGLIDLVAWLRHSGMMDETGYLELSDGKDAFFPDHKMQISLNQRDIRQLQLAKGAIAAGIVMLCQRAGIRVEEITRIHLAGGFGSFIRADSAIDIGLLPACFTGKVSTAGNTSLRGALQVISCFKAIDQCIKIAHDAKVVDLAAETGFQSVFAECMLFPEEFVTDLS